MKQLTVDILKEMKPHTMFAKGFCFIEHPWFNDAKPVSQGGTLEPDGRSTKVKWVAVRGIIHDWAIYHSMDANFVYHDFFDNPIHLQTSYEKIADLGAKLRQVDVIKKLVNPDEGALQMYRY